MMLLGVNFDEISDHMAESISVMQELGIKNGELRTIDGKNVVLLSDEEINSTKTAIDRANIKLVAIASPLFKWYIGQDFRDVEHDNFGFSPRLSFSEKIKYIDRTIEIARKFGIRRIRIFSNLSDGSLSIETFINDKSLAYALNSARKAGVVLLIENEPVCIVNKKKHILKLFRSINDPALGLWLDLANLIELGENIDPEFLKEVGPHIGYMHIKDFSIEDNKRVYKALGLGDIDYLTILKFIHRAVGGRDIPLTVETHVHMSGYQISPEEKREASITSLRNAKIMLKSIEE